MDEKGQIECDKPKGKNINFDQPWKIQVNF